MYCLLYGKEKPGHSAKLLTIIFLLYKKSIQYSMWVLNDLRMSKWLKKMNVWIVIRFKHQIWNVVLCHFPSYTMIANRKRVNTWMLTRTCRKFIFCSISALNHHCTTVSAGEQPLPYSPRDIHCLTRLNHTVVSQQGLNICLKQCIVLWKKIGISRFLSKD